MSGSPTIFVAPRERVTIDISSSPAPVWKKKNPWYAYQKRAEFMISDYQGKMLDNNMSNLMARNRRINQAYANLWLRHNEFQWAGLAAFASKQVGCGLLHATEVSRTAEAVAMNTWLFLPKLLPVTAIGVSGMAYYTYEMLTLGNTTLFLDIYPLHAFFEDHSWEEDGTTWNPQKGSEALQKYLSIRKDIFDKPDGAPIYWPVSQEILEFGKTSTNITDGFNSIVTGDLLDSVKFLAYHEQVDVLQPVIYNNWAFKKVLQANQVAYVTDLPGSSGIELTLSNQCTINNSQQTINFSDSKDADLADPNQRMPFVLRAANQFNDLLKTEHSQIEKAIIAISNTGGGG